MTVKNKNNKRSVIELTSMTIPGLLLLFIFCYLPMFGIVVAFKDFNYVDGIFRSPWVGLDNFMFLFKSRDAFRIIRNTLLYNCVFIVLEMAAGVGTAIALLEIRSKKLIKLYQTSMLLPHFVSWVIVSYIVYIFLNPAYGIVNRVLGALGLQGVQWYSEYTKWPFILTISQIWKALGMKCIMYYAVLMGMDMEVVEAAKIDGAGKLQQIWHVVIPTLVPTMIILGIMAVGNIFKGDFGLFYQVPRNVGALYPTTDVIDTYVYRALQTGNIGMSSAVGFLQSVVGLITVVAANRIVKCIDADRAMF